MYFVWLGLIRFSQCIFFIYFRNNWFSLYRFDRDWKKIEDFVGSKTVIQVQAHWFAPCGFGFIFYYSVSSVLGNHYLLLSNSFFAFADSKSCPKIFLESSKEWYSGTCTSSSPEAKGFSSLSTKGIQKWCGNLEDN